MVYAVAMCAVPGAGFATLSSAMDPPLNSELGRFTPSSEMYGQRVVWGTDDVSRTALRSMFTEMTDGLTFKIGFWAKEF